MELDNEYKNFLNIMMNLKSKLNNMDESIFIDVKTINKYLNKPFDLMIENEFKEIINQDVQHKRFLLRFLLKINSEQVKLYILNLYLSFAIDEMNNNKNVFNDRILFVEYLLGLDFNNFKYKVEISACYEYAILFCLELKNQDYILKLTEKINS